mmetsp:Transcript_25039/g.22210  ORF Transcript_25039/g.22210 Transcript_25039/m.22210 type:complete len:135 (-) Transcript_25039:8-412(-)
MNGNNDILIENKNCSGSDEDYSDESLIGSEKDQNSKTKDDTNSNPNNCIILKDPESDDILTKLVEISKQYEDRREPGDNSKVVISAFKITPNNFAEKPVYDRSSEDDVDSVCGLKRLREDVKGNTEDEVKRIKS